MQKRLAQISRLVNFGLFLYLTWEASQQIGKTPLPEPVTRRDVVILIGGLLIIWLCGFFAGVSHALWRLEEKSESGRA